MECNEKYDKYEIIDGKGAILIKDNKYIIIDIHGNVISKGLYVYVVDYNEGSVLVGQYGTGVNDLFVYTFLCVFRNNNTIHKFRTKMFNICYIRITHCRTNIAFHIFNPCV